MTDAQYYRFCMTIPDLRVERTSEGDILIMPPPGAETSWRNSELTMQLGNWAQEDGRGLVFDSSVEYFLPSGAAYSPDASWVLRSRVDKLTRSEKRRFPHLCPDFVVDVSFRPSVGAQGQDARMDRKRRAIGMAARPRSSHRLLLSSGPRARATRHPGAHRRRGSSGRICPRTCACLGRAVAFGAQRARLEWYQKATGHASQRLT